MTMQPDDLPGSHVPTGLRTAALIVLLGLVAVVSEPMLRHAAPVAEAKAPAAAAPASTTYFPSLYPAPTTVAEPAPTF